MIRHTITYIEQQLCFERKALSLDEVTEKIGYSKFYLNRIFKEQVGIPIHQYVLWCLTKAAGALVYTDKPIVEIAFEAAYQS